MTNRLFIGFSEKVELPRGGGFLFVHDDIPDIRRARVFDPTVSSFNPLKGIAYKAARDLADVLYATSPQGENTLTVRNGRRALLQALLEADRFDKIQGGEEVDAMVTDLLTSPVLRHALTNTTRQFSFNPNSIILAKINRAELGDFDALVLGLLLMNHYQGQIVVPDFGFYGRNVHTNLVRQNRLIAGLNYLAEVPLQLRTTLLAVKDKTMHAVLYEDADMLARHAGLIPGTTGFSDFVSHAMS